MPLRLQPNFALVKWHGSNTKHDGKTSKIHVMYIAKPKRCELAINCEFSTKALKFSGCGPTARVWHGTILNLGKPSVAKPKGALPSTNNKSSTQSKKRADKPPTVYTGNTSSSDDDEVPVASGQCGRSLPSPINTPPPTEKRPRSPSPSPAKSPVSPFKTPRSTVRACAMDGLQTHASPAYIPNNITMLNYSQFNPMDAATPFDPIRRLVPNELNCSDEIIDKLNQQLIMQAEGNVLMREIKELLERQDARAIQPATPVALPVVSAEVEPLRQEIDQVRNYLASTTARAQICIDPLVDIAEVLDNGQWRNKRGNHQLVFNCLARELAKRVFFGETVLQRSNGRRAQNGNNFLDPEKLNQLKQAIRTKYPGADADFEAIWKENLASLQRYCKELRQAKIAAATSDELRAMNNNVA